MSLNGLTDHQREYLEAYQRETDRIESFDGRLASDITLESNFTNREVTQEDFIKSMSSIQNEYKSERPQLEHLKLLGYDTDEEGLILKFDSKDSNKVCLRENLHKKDTIIFSDEYTKRRL